MHPVNQRSGVWHCDNGASFSRNPYHFKGWQIYFVKADLFFLFLQKTGRGRIQKLHILISLLLIFYEQLYCVIYFFIYEHVREVQKLKGLCLLSWENTFFVITKAQVLSDTQSFHPSPLMHHSITVLTAWSKSEMETWMEKN